MRWGAEDYSEWEAKRRRRRWLQRRLKKFSVWAIFLAAFWAAWEYLPRSMDLSHIYKQWSQERSAREQLIYYPNCAAAWEAGVAPIHAGQPGYRQELDGDYDGIACEPIPLRRRWTW
jgi:hypothetical protein